MSVPTMAEVTAYADTLRREKAPEARLAIACAALLSLEWEHLADLFDGIVASVEAEADDWPFPGVDREMFGRVMKEERQREQRVAPLERRRAAA